MAFDRTTLLREPGLVSFNSQTFYSVGPIAVDFINNWTPVPSDMFGNLGNRAVDRRVEIRFTPIGELEALSTLFPHTSKTLGASLFGGTDAACTIFTPGGRSLVVHNVAITSQPTVILAHDKTLFGEVVLTGLIRKDYEPNDAAAYYTWTNSGASYPGDAALSASNIKTLGYKAAWGGTAPWDEFFSESGFTLATELQTEDQMVDGHGTVDITLRELAASITGVPVGVTINDLLSKQAFQGSNNQLGANLTSGDDLIITNALGSLQLHVQLYGARLDDNSIAFSAQQNNIAELTWRATREFSTGTPVPLYYIGTTAPA